LSEAKNEQDYQYQHVSEHKAHITAGESVMARGRRTERAVCLGIPAEVSHIDSAKPMLSELKEKKDF